MWHETARLAHLRPHLTRVPNCSPLSDSSDTGLNPRTNAHAHTRICASTSMWSMCVRCSRDSRFTRHAGTSYTYASKQTRFARVSVNVTLCVHITRIARRAAPRRLRSVLPDGPYQFALSFCKWSIPRHG